MRNITLVIFGMVVLIAGGCAQPMKLDARRWDVMRPDGTASIQSYVVTDRSLSREQIESVALCVAPIGIDPLDSLENLAGACAAGCELLVVTRTTSDESRVDDHLMVLRRFLDQRATPPRSVIVIGLRGGDAVATTIANREARVTHLALLAPKHSTPTVPQPVFIALLGGVSDPSPRANVTVRHYPLADEQWRDRRTRRTIRPLIEMDLIAWLTDTNALTNTRATQLASRVKASHPEWYSSRGEE